MTPEETAAAILQARMSWPEAERCAALLARGGWPANRAQAVSALERILPLSRACSAVDDLVMHGLIPAGEEDRTDG